MKEHIRPLNQKEHVNPLNKKEHIGPLSIELIGGEAAMLLWYNAGAAERRSRPQPRFSISLLAFSCEESNI